MTDDHARLRKRIASREALALASHALDGCGDTVPLSGATPGDALEDAIVAAFDFAAGSLASSPGYDALRPFVVIQDPTAEGTEFSLRVLDETRGRVRGGWTVEAHAKNLADKLNRNWRLLGTPLPRLGS